MDGKKSRDILQEENTSGLDDSVSAVSEGNEEILPEEISGPEDHGILSRAVSKLENYRFFSFLIAWIKRLGQDSVNLVSAQLAYYLILSFFPFTIFLLSIFSYSRFGQEEILSQQLALLPPAAADIIQPIIMDIIGGRSATLLSSSLILTLWSSSTGMNNLLNSMTKTFHKGENERPFWRSRLVALAATVLVVVLIALMLVSQVFGGVIYSYLSDYFSWGDLAKTIWDYTLTLIPLVILSLGLAFLYRYGPYFPKGKRPGFGKAWVSGIVASVSWILISYLFSMYVTNFANYANVYGSLGGIIMLILWLYFSAFCIMAGSVFASVLQNRGHND